MFELRVSGYAEARLYLADGWPTRVVRLLPVEEVNGEPEPVPAGHLHVDVSDTNLDESDPIVPMMCHLRTILAFTKDLTDDDRLLVHCFAGIGRSTAAAIGICIQHGMAFNDAFDHVAKIRDFLRPNRDLIRLIDQYFGLEGQLIEYARQHKPKF